MPRRTQAKKTISKKIGRSVSKAPAKGNMRFSVSLVILIGMLSFSVLLLLFSMTKPVGQEAATKTSAVMQRSNVSNAPKAVPPQPYVFQSGGEDFRLSFPTDWKGWVFRTGEVKSLIDDSLSDSYVRISLPQSVADNVDANSPNLDSRYGDMITVFTYSADEWKAMEKKCNRGNAEVCDRIGTKLADTVCPGFAGDTDCVYSFTKEPNCPASFTAQCGEVDKIMQSFKIVE